jgi:hypothetical protein
LSHGFIEFHPFPPKKKSIIVISVTNEDLVQAWKCITHGKNEVAEFSDLPIDGIRVESYYSIPASTSHIMIRRRNHGT